MISFEQFELIGDTKVGVLPQQVNQLEMCREIAAAKDLEENDSSFMLVDLDKMIERFELWGREPPISEPFDAVKRNTDFVVIRIVASLGC